MDLLNSESKQTFLSSSCFFQVFTPATRKITSAAPSPLDIFLLRRKIQEHLCKNICTLDFRKNVQAQNQLQNLWSPVQNQHTETFAHQLVRVLKSWQHSRRLWALSHVTVQGDLQEAGLATALAPLMVCDIHLLPKPFWSWEQSQPSNYLFPSLAVVASLGPGFQANKSTWLSKHPESGMHSFAGECYSLLKFPSGPPLPVAFPQWFLGLKWPLCCPLHQHTTAFITFYSLNSCCYFCCSY